jgi:hypothetical protein
MPLKVQLCIISELNVDIRKPREVENAKLIHITRIMVSTDIIGTCTKNTAKVIRIANVGRLYTSSDIDIPKIYINALVGELTIISCILKSFLKWDKSICSTIPLDIIVESIAPIIAISSNAPFDIKMTKIKRENGVSNELITIVG